MWGPAGPRAPAKFEPCTPMIYLFPKGPFSYLRKLSDNSFPDITSLKYFITTITITVSAPGLPMGMCKLPVQAITTHLGCRRRIQDNQPNVSYHYTVKSRLLTKIICFTSFLRCLYFFSNLLVATALPFTLRVLCRESTFTGTAPLRGWVSLRDWVSLRTGVSLRGWVSPRGWMSLRAWVSL